MSRISRRAVAAMLAVSTLLPGAAFAADAPKEIRIDWATYKVPVIVTRASNNYGPNQFPEKIIPLFITNLIDGLPVPLYGDGQNVRDWLHVEDHCRGVDMLLEKSEPGEVYNIGGGNEVKNVDLTHRLLQLLDRPTSLITPVSDRPGHDRRYSLSTAKLQALGWKPKHDFVAGLDKTVRWYIDNAPWIARVKSGAYREWLDKNYGTR